MLFLLLLIQIANCQVEMTDLILKEAVQNDQSWLVMFYAPWCGVCKQIKPEFENANYYFENQIDRYIKPEQKIRFGKFNCETYANECNEWGVKSYPKIKIIHQGSIYDYNGDRKKEAFIRLVKKLYQPAVISIKDDKSFSTFKKESNVSFILFSQLNDQNSNKARNYLEQIAKKYRISEIQFGDCQSTEIQNEQEISKTPLLRKYGKDEQWQFQMDNLNNEDGITQFIEIHRYPLIFKPDATKFRQIVPDFRDNNIRLILLASDGSKEAKNLENLLTQFAKNEKDKGNFEFQPVIIDAQENKEQLSSYTDKFPAVVVLQFNQEPFPYYNVQANYLESLSSLEIFLQDILKGKIEPKQPQITNYYQKVLRMCAYLFSTSFLYNHTSTAILLYSIIILGILTLIHLFFGRFKQKYEDKEQKGVEKEQEAGDQKKQKGSKTSKSKAKNE